MTKPYTPPRTPAGLKAAGKRLWSSIADVYGLHEHERATLLAACRCADLLDRLAGEAAAHDVTVVNTKGDQVVHPAIAEMRAQSLALTRMLASLRLPSGDESDVAEQMRRPQRRGGARGFYGIRGAV